MTVERIDLDLEAADDCLNHCCQEIKVVHNDIDLLRTPSVNALSQIEYLEEMNMEREGRINQLKERNTRMEKRMRELEEVLATMKFCCCQEVPHPGSRGNPIKVSNLDYAKEYLTPPAALSLESKEGEV